MNIAWYVAFSANGIRNLLTFAINTFQDVMRARH